MFLLKGLEFCAILCASSALPVVMSLIKPLSSLDFNCAYADSVNVIATTAIRDSNPIIMN